MTTKILCGIYSYVRIEGYFNLNLNAGSDPDVTEMFRQMKNLLPGMNPFNLSLLSHKYNTRNKSKLHTDRCRTKMRQSTVQFQGPKLWNSLVPQNIVDEPSLGVFKNSIKNFLASSM